MNFDGNILFQHKLIHNESMKIDYKEEAEKWRARCESLEAYNSDLLVRLEAAEKKAKHAHVKILKLKAELLLRMSESTEVQRVVDNVSSK